MDVDEEAGQEALENQSDLDQIKKSMGERHECPETAEDAGHQILMVFSQKDTETTSPW